MHAATIDDAADKGQRQLRNVATFAVVPDEPRFDALAEAERQWRSHGIDRANDMHAILAIVHARQLVITAIDRALRPLELTFARYEVLMLLQFSANGRLPITKVGERLLVHPTGITRIVDRLEEQGLASRETNPDDRRSTLVCITPKGRKSAARATDTLVTSRFGVTMQAARLEQLIELLDEFRTTFNAPP